MSIFSRRKVAEHVKGYREGRRLMRQGDGADEWIGMDITKRNLLALVSLGRNEFGEKATIEERREVLRVHGLRKEAELLQ